MSPTTMAMQALCDEYGFELVPATESPTFSDGFRNGFAVRGTDTDGNPADWFAYDETEQSVGYMTPDHNNMWLCQTRPDLDVDKLVAFLSEATMLMDEPGMSISDFVDPEDWQEIDGALEPDIDPRYQFPLDRLSA